MLLDHLNSYLLGGAHEWMWQAGRIVFPIFALVLGVGISARGGDLWRLVVRILALAAVAELAAWPLVADGVRPAFLNVCFTLGAGVLLVQADRERGWRRHVAVGLALVLSWGAEYGFLGAALVWAAARRSWAWVYVLLGVLALWQGSPVPLLAVLAVWWCDREAAGLAVRGWRMAFGAGYVAQFVLWGLLAQ